MCVGECVYEGMCVSKEICVMYVQACVCMRKCVQGNLFKGMCVMCVRECVYRGMCGV